ncbi:aminoglycoside phosphotransferase family protein [Agromyces larvae]|uniref:Aminoglycoside phosphotransferase family protein n=1 Tax=Agromyces larvae TaxID=2929802 RepID=A0ABY4C076_9MICO|nr:aminoglycoside phosphotransferase family protein [Agromyces larvae]UOE43346.1 aminoglycoside phosphotransferase family protein [Agromyces larvae]
MSGWDASRPGMATDASVPASATDASPMSATGASPVRQAPDAPPADVASDPSLVAALVAAQHPDLAGPVREVASGWDNTVFRLGERLAVRMPRRELGAHLVAGEQRWLPELAPRLPAPVPAPVRVGRPALGYPYPWSIVPWFDGVDAASVAPADRGEAADGLAGFLAALGDPRAPAPADAPANPYRGVPLVDRDPITRERIDAAVAQGLVDASAAAVLDAVRADALAAPVWAGPPVWVHGDPHPANLLLEASGSLAAVLDFGDLTLGDPACDLATGWLTFDAAGRARFRAAIEARRETDAADWRRARGWAVALGLAIVTAVGVDGRVGRIGAHALAEVVAEAR